MSDSHTLPKFDSSTSFTGLDFLARSLIRMEQNGTRLEPGDMAGNMTDEQREIFMARVAFHRDCLSHKNR
ncbi:hypothetical protein [[Enterobacter] lignolyticus]|uniref:Surface composition regulator n=2 Tax=[Enterobacter] lignolyticus TaxID=1334193 RepID=E3G2J7_ENTLS|nr:hypothetical protein [[Enterobacter] lignolyticus]ADO46936.1 hypothetical protein Entcl_0659 [[Enterobacter] lignolyticus SCF1]ALR78129.1 hypothetical protein AO703_18160 [[Enterobacter] lignolyticus]